MNPHSPSRSESQTRPRQRSQKRALGSITPLLDDPRVVEIMLNADGVVWFEKVGVGMQPAGMRLLPVEAERMLRLLASEMLVELNADHPSLSAKLPAPWGARVQASIPPIVDAPTFAIRKPACVVFSLADYVQKGILTPRQEQELLRAVHGHDNILIGGGTGSGKTTFANALLKVIADGTDRVHIIEDTPELQCEAPNKVQVLVQPPVHTWRDAVMAAMRYRPDRILVGEVRDGSALELLKAWNTGHPGGLATIHANDTKAMLDRLCQLIEEVVYPAPRALVAQTIQVCAHIQRDKSPTRRATPSSGLDRVRGVAADGSWKLERISLTPTLRVRTMHPYVHDTSETARLRTRTVQLLILVGLIALSAAPAWPGTLGGLGSALGGGMPWRRRPLPAAFSTRLDGRPTVARHRSRRHHRPRRRHRLLGGRVDDAQGALGRARPRHRVQRGVLGHRLSRLLGRPSRMNRLDGLEVPLHRSIVEPMLLAGLPRAVALVLWTAVGAFSFGLHQLWVLPIGIVLHLGAAAATKADPHFFDIVLVAIKTQKRLEP